MTDLNAGNASAVQSTDLPALNKALDHVSMYVGSTAASMSAVSSASQILTQQLTSQNNQLNDLTQTNLPNVTVQLQQIQTQYQASLAAGSRILASPSSTTCPPPSPRFESRSNPMKNTTADTLTVENLRDKVIQFGMACGFPTQPGICHGPKAEERPFAWMQSVSDPDLVFAVVDAYAWVKDFMLEVDDAELLEMGSLDPMDYAVYFILRIQEQDSRMTLRAKPNAPVLVNTKNRRAKQIVIPLNSTLEDAEALCLQL